MQEYKFRAWDKEFKGMFYGGFSIHATGCIKSDWFNPDNLILMQFTGLHDKNGKEIYEGDIVNENVEIIGNIYKNPELLRENNDNY